MNRPRHNALLELDFPSTKSRASYGHGDCREIPGEDDAPDFYQEPTSFAAYRVFAFGSRVVCPDGRGGVVEFSHPFLATTTVEVDGGERRRFRSTELVAEDEAQPQAATA